MEPRPVTAHPAFLPLLGALAVVVALMALQVAPVVAPNATPSTATDRISAHTAPPARPVVADVPVEITARVLRVELAREHGGADSVLVVERGVARPVATRLMLSARTGILVPMGTTMGVGGPTDLQPGDTVLVTLEPGQPLAQRARVAGIRVDHARPAAQRTATAEA